MTESVWNIDKLREIAIDQLGFVTTEQAGSVGVTRHALSMLVKRGRLERVAFGVYRVPQIPHTQYDSFMLAVLWSGTPEAVLSHETALAAYDVSDINPFKIHITLPKGRRINRHGGEKYILHYQDLDPRQKAWWERIPIVTLPTAIKQCISYGTPSYLVRQAIENGTKRGLVLPNEKENFMKMLEERT